MSSEALPVDPTMPPHERLFDRFDLDMLGKDLSGAIRRGHVAVAQAIIGLANGTQTTAVDTAHHRMMELSMPRLEQRDLLARGKAIDDILEAELDGIYEKTGRAIEVLAVERNRVARSNDPLDLIMFAHLTGGISELATFGLYNRQGSRSPFMAIASTEDQEHAGRNRDGENLAFDLRVWTADVTQDEAQVQVKTSKTAFDVYAKNVLLIAMNDLAGSRMAGMVALPNAIIQDARGGLPKQDQRLINRATSMLHRKTEAHIADNK